jgi:hypothetical protein
MRFDGVVMSPPLLDEHLRLVQRRKLLPGKQLVAELGIEALAVAVLPRTAGSMKSVFTPTRSRRGTWLRAEHESAATPQAAGATTPVAQHSSSSLKIILGCALGHRVMDHAGVSARQHDGRSRQSDPSSRWHNAQIMIALLRTTLSMTGHAVSAGSIFRKRYCHEDHRISPDRPVRSRRHRGSVGRRRCADVLRAA